MLLAVLLMTRMIRFIAIIALYATFSVSNINIVQKCPLDAVAWRERENIFGCPYNSLSYHCIMSDNDTLYELCLEKWNINSFAEGCPVVAMLGTGIPDFILPFSKCPVEVTGCPEDGHPPYMTNELYKYPKCFIPESERYENKTASKPASPTTPGQIAEKGHTWIYAVVISLIIVIIILIIIGIVILVKNWRRHSFRKWRRDTFTCCCCRVKRQKDFGIEICQTGSGAQERERLLIEGGATVEKHAADDEGRERKNYLVLLKLKWTLWNHLEVVRGKKSFREFMDDPKTRHILFHQWRNVPCCECTSNPEFFRRRFISNGGWKSVYEQYETNCPQNYGDCSCKYQSKDTDIHNISIATLLCIVNSVGDLNRMGKRCLTEIRQCCERVFQGKIADASDDIIHQIDLLISTFVVNSKISTTSGDTPETPQDTVKVRRNYTTDLADLFPFEVNELNEENLSKYIARTTEVLNEDAFYVSVPRWEDEVCRSLKEDRFVIVSGHIGEGKSTLCREILRKVSKEYKSEREGVILKLEPNQVRFQFLYQYRRSCLLYFEDFLGTSHYAKLYSREKSSFYKDCLDSIKRFPNISIICCARSVVLEEANSDMQRVEDPSKYIFDLSSKWKLTKEEMLHSLTQHEERYKTVRLSEDDKKQILAKATEDNYFGFPEYCTLCYKAEQGKKVFFHPEEEVEREIEQLRDDKNPEYFILVYILLKNKSFSLKNVDAELLSRIDGKFVLQLSLEEYVFRFLRKDSSNVYTFQHQFIQESVLRVFGTDNNEMLLKLAADDVVTKFVRPSSYTPRNEQEVYLCLREENDSTLANKLLMAYNYRNISNHVTTRDKNFVSKHVLPVLESNLLRRLEREAKQKNSSDFVENTIKNVISEASSNSNETLLECFIQHYSEILSSCKTELSGRLENGRSHEFRIAQYFAKHLPHNISPLSRNRQIKAAVLSNKNSD